MGFGRRLGALAFSGFGGRGRRMLRGDNVSLPHLQQKVILGRVASVNEDGFYTVNTGFKRCALTRRNAPSRAPSRRADRSSSSADRAAVETKPTNPN
jgi:hypothetical protein